MWIVASGARHGVASLLLADALRQRLDLADRSKFALRVRKSKVMDVFRQFLARLVFVEMAPGLFNRRPALEMALHADLVAPGRIEFGGINDCAAFRVLFSWSVAAFATDAGLGERRVWVTVLRSLNRRLHAADVAMKATGEGRQIQWELGCIAESGRHIPDVPRSGLGNGFAFLESAVACR